MAGPINSDTFRAWAAWSPYEKMDASLKRLAEQKAGAISA